MRYLYSLFVALVLPFLWLLLCWRYRGADYNQRWRERFGIVSESGCTRPCLWLHTASVGEVIAAKKLVEHLINEFSHYRILITTTTPSGAEQVKNLFADNVRHCYLPYDLSYFFVRFLKVVKPVAVLIMETEMWPNMLAICHQSNIPSILINARMSSRSCRAYRRLACLSESMFSQLTMAVAQTAADAKRLQCLGAKNISVSGNIKMDLDISAEHREKAKKLAVYWSNQGRRKVLIAASTHLGEDEKLLLALQKLRQLDPEILLVLVPRHPQRFEEVRQLSLQKGYRVSRHSKDSVDESTDVVIGDTVGELMVMYGASNIAFVGGSLVDNGGHNMLEPAAWGLPVVTGSSVYNFAAIVDGLASIQGIRVVNNSRELTENLIELITHSEIRCQMGAAACQYVESNKGALEKLLRCLDPILDNLHSHKKYPSERLG